MEASRTADRGIGSGRDDIWHLAGEGLGLMNCRWCVTARSVCRCRAFNPGEDQRAGARTSDSGHSRPGSHNQVRFSCCEHARPPAASGVPPRSISGDRVATRVVPFGTGSPRLRTGKVRPNPSVLAGCPTVRAFIAASLSLSCRQLRRRLVPDAAARLSPRQTKPRAQC